MESLMPNDRLAPGVAGRPRIFERGSRERHARGAATRRKYANSRAALRAHRLQPRKRMLVRPLRPRSIALVITAAFLLGAGSAEVAVRTHDAIERVRQEREVGAAGQLLQLEISSPGGEVLARPRLIAPTGKAAELV